MPTFPKTRYRGSKRKIVAWIWDVLSQYEFTTCLDAFGGTGVVSYKFKQEGKKVTFNDLLSFNVQFGKALIENDTIFLDDVDSIFQPVDLSLPPGFISQTFPDIYFTNDENLWLDQTILRIHQIQNPYKKSLAFFVLCQACLVKRPFNLFHRANVYMRFAKVKRSFGNATSWNRPFLEWIPSLVEEVNKAPFQGLHPCTAVQGRASEVVGDFDLIYVDPPYLKSKSSGTNYEDLYHFLEGLWNLDLWNSQIDFKSKHRKMIRTENPWNNVKEIHKAFDTFFGNYKESIFAVSYRDDGIPTIAELVNLLKRHRRYVNIEEYGTYQYSLSKNKKSKEVLLLAYD